MKEQSFHITWILDLVQPYKAVRTVISPLQKSKKGIKETSLIKNNLTVQWKKPRRQGEFKVLRIDWHQQGRPVRLEFLPVPVHSKRHLAESKARNLQHKQTLALNYQPVQSNSSTAWATKKRERERERQTDLLELKEWKGKMEMILSLIRSLLSGVEFFFFIFRREGFHSGSMTFSIFHFSVCTNLSLSFFAPKYRLFSSSPIFRFFLLRTRASSFFSNLLLFFYQQNTEARSIFSLIQRKKRIACW